jgi:hypothetical protein
MITTLKTNNYGKKANDREENNVGEGREATTDAEGRQGGGDDSF